MSRKGSNRGRPPKLPSLPDAVFKAIVEAVGQGVPKHRAAALAGVTGWALYKWLARGKKDTSGVYFQFVQAVKNAEAEFIARNVKAIEKAGEGSWQARAWLLERKFPDEFSLQRQELAALKRELADLLKRLEAQNGAAQGDVGEAPPG